MCYITRRRERLLDRKLRKNHENSTIHNAFSNVILLLVAVYLIFHIPLAIDGIIKPVASVNQFISDNYIFPALYFPFYIIFMITITFYWLPDRCFKFCALLAISQVLIILFIIFHPYHTFVPGPFTETLMDVFRLSYYAAFIWIPLLIISLLSCAIISWKASDQSELYTVVYGGKGSSTKKCYV